MKTFSVTLTGCTAESVARAARAAVDLYAHVSELETERDRLRALLHELYLACKTRSLFEHDRYNAAMDAACKELKE